MTSPDPVVELGGVRVVHGGVTTLDVPALEVRGGERLVVIGPNGSGKSTLLRVIGLLQRPAAGEVRLRGRPVPPGSMLAERRRMAMVFQDPLLVDASVTANVALGLRFRGVSRGATVEPVRRWLARLGIAGLGARRARTLSGGEAQRVALARALVLEPELLLLDEPFASLDAPSRATLLGELDAILRADGVTTVLVTHDRGEAQVMGDRVAVLMTGRVRQLESAAAVFQSPATEEVARFVGVETIVDGRVREVAGGVTAVEVGPRTIAAAHPAVPGERVRLCLRPEDVILAPAGEDAALTSARNRLPGVVVEVTVASSHVRVLVDCGFPLVAAVTRRSVEDLGLTPGVPVVAMFKASAVHVLRAAPFP